MKKFLIILMSFAITIAGCTTNAKSKDIVILFTSDIHCSVNENIGYAGFNSYKKSKELTNEYVTLVDLGDAVQGKLIGSVSEGMNIIEIMNYLEYDLAVLGNHEFDYSVNQTKRFIDEFNGTYLTCNLKYTGENEDPFLDLKPYKIISYGEIDVAYIGVLTPTTISTTPSYFQENGKYVYDFYAGEQGKKFIDIVQENINECLSKGADYVVGLCHTGSTVDDEPYSSRSLIKGTTGFDVVFDGHSHVKINSETIKDKNGNDVLLGSVGENLEAFGELVIPSKGDISLKYIDNYENKDDDTTKFIDNIISKFEEEFNKPLVTINKSLSLYDENGIRMVRNREMPIGNLISDAYRFVGETDVGFFQGGGIRDGLYEGEVSYADLLNIHPYGNRLTTVKATGQEIIDSLEISTLSVYSEYVKDGEPYGENGGYLHVSGLKYDVDTSIPTPVILNEYEDFVEIKGPRKVSNVRILENDEYISIDPNKTYTVSTTDYIIKKAGCSNNLFLDNELIIDSGIYDYQVLAEYLTNWLKGDLTKYLSIEGRMNIIG